jgi:DNA-binding NarL/FixJ family response regulator
MRVVLVGRPPGRERLRAALARTGLDVVGEVATMAAAREGGVDVDAYVVAPAEPPGAAPISEDAPDTVEHLTPRELDVLDLLTLGLPNRQIAARLGISDQTVKFHVASILGKLGAANRTDVVRRAARRGIIDL